LLEHDLPNDLALTDTEIALVKLKQGAISAKPTEVIARAPREQITDATLATGSATATGLSSSSELRPSPRLEAGARSASAGIRVDHQRASAT
jgi:hypothetical protein